MATISATATAHPPYLYNQEEILQSLSIWLTADDRMLALARRVFANAAVQNRYGCRALFDLVNALSITEASRLYQEQTQILGERVARDCLAQANIQAKAVNLIITTSCTGFMIPSLDAYLANTLEFSPHIKRLPITELGCAAGAVALSRAFDYLQAFPTHTVLDLAVELPSLTFQVQDLSPANIISSALFGDGAAAVLLTGRSQEHKPHIVATESTLFPHTTDLMGFDLRDSGLHIVLSSEIPEVVCEEAPQLVSSFLARYGLTTSEITHFLLHPGGRRVLENLTRGFSLSEERTAVSREILREYGNLSSASVLFILDRFLKREETKSGDHGLLLAFGPGFSAESVLLEWT